MLKLISFFFFYEFSYDKIIWQHCCTKQMQLYVDDQAGSETSKGSNPFLWEDRTLYLSNHYFCSLILPNSVLNLAVGVTDLISFLIFTLNLTVFSEHCSKRRSNCQCPARCRWPQTAVWSPSPLFFFFFFSTGTHNPSKKMYWTPPALSCPLSVNMVSRPPFQSHHNPLPFCPFSTGTVWCVGPPPSCAWLQGDTPPSAPQPPATSPVTLVIHVFHTPLHLSLSLYSSVFTADFALK